MLSWNVANVQAVYLYGGQFGTSPVPVTGKESRSVCPRVDTTYTLRFVSAGKTTNVPLLVDVRDTIPPATPVGSIPKGTLSVYSCSGTVTMQWSGVTDQSGIARYDWYIYQIIYIGGIPYFPTVASGQSTTTSGQTASLTCGQYYYWAVRAVDGAGNAGAYSASNGFVMYEALR